MDPIGEEEDEDCVEDVTPPPLPGHQLSLPPRLNGPHPQYQVELPDYPASLSYRSIRYVKVSRGPEKRIPGIFSTDSDPAQLEKYSGFG